MGESIKERAAAIVARGEKRIAELEALRRHQAYDYGYSNGWADCFEEMKRRCLAGELPDDWKRDG